MEKYTESEAYQSKKNELLIKAEQDARNIITATFGSFIAKKFEAYLEILRKSFAHQLDQIAKHAEEYYLNVK